MPRNVFNVVIDKIISAARVKVRNDDDNKTWEIDASTGCGSVAVKSLKPDGANTMPAGDAAARSIFTRVTDGANSMPAGDAAARAIFAKITDGANNMPAADSAARAHFTRFVPNRPASDLGAPIITFDHGTVAADWSNDLATSKTQNANYDLWITEISLFPLTDPTAEVGIQEIPFEIIISDVTDGENRALLMGGIPGNTHFRFGAPLKIQKGHSWYSLVRLGGATNLNIYTVINGFEEA